MADDIKEDSSGSGSDNTLTEAELDIGSPVRSQSRSGECHVDIIWLYSSSSSFYSCYCSSSGLCPSDAVHRIPGTFHSPIGRPPKSCAVLRLR